MTKNIRILEKRVGSPAFISKVKEDELNDRLGGWFKTIPIRRSNKEFTIIFDEEAMQKNLPYNCTVHGIFNQPYMHADIVGTMFVVEEIDWAFADFTPTLEEAQKLFPELFGEE